MFQWLIFLVDIPGNEMPLYAPDPGMPISPPSVNACLVFHLAPADPNSRKAPFTLFVIWRAVCMALTADRIPFLCLPW